MRRGMHDSEGDRGRQGDGRQTCRRGRRVADRTGWGGGSSKARGWTGERLLKERASSSGSERRGRGVDRCTRIMTRWIGKEKM